MVKTDSKYSFSKLALSMSLVRRFELSDFSGATPESWPILLFTNL